MRRPRIVRILLAILWAPVVFLSICVGWGVVDTALASWEVSNYIRHHQTLVAQRLADPRVHAFTLSRDPDAWGTLLIKFDVDDKQTYELLESDLNDIYGMRNPPRWDTIVRSKEDLGNNFGYAAWGMNEVGEAMLVALLAAVAAISWSLTLLVLAICRPERRDLHV